MSSVRRLPTQGAEKHTTEHLSPKYLTILPDPPQHPSSPNASIQGGNVPIRPRRLKNKQLRMDVLHQSPAYRFIPNPQTSDSQGGKRKEDGQAYSDHVEDPSAKFEARKGTWFLVWLCLDATHSLKCFSTSNPVYHHHIYPAVPLTHPAVQIHLELFKDQCPLPPLPTSGSGLDTIQTSKGLRTNAASPSHTNTTTQSCKDCVRAHGQYIKMSAQSTSPSERHSSIEHLGQSAEYVVSFTHPPLWKLPLESFKHRSAEGASSVTSQPPTSSGTPGPNCPLFVDEDRCTVFAFGNRRTYQSWVQILSEVYGSRMVAKSMSVDATVNLGLADPIPCKSTRRDMQGTSELLPPQGFSRHARYYPHTKETSQQWSRRVLHSESAALRREHLRNRSHISHFHRRYEHWFTKPLIEQGHNKKQGAEQGSAPSDVIRDLEPGLQKHWQRVESFPDDVESFPAEMSLTSENASPRIRPPETPSCELILNTSNVTIPSNSSKTNVSEKKRDTSKSITPLRHQSPLFGTTVSYMRNTGPQNEKLDPVSLKVFTRRNLQRGGMLRSVTVPQARIIRLYMKEIKDSSHSRGDEDRHQSKYKSVNTKCFHGTRVVQTVSATRTQLEHPVQPPFQTLMPLQTHIEHHTLSCSPDREHEVNAMKARIAQIDEQNTKYRETIESLKKELEHINAVKETFTAARWERTQQAKDAAVIEHQTKMQADVESFIQACNRKVEEYQNIIQGFRSL